MTPEEWAKEAMFKLGYNPNDFMCKPWIDKITEAIKGALLEAHDTYAGGVSDGIEHATKLERDRCGNRLDTLYDEGPKNNANIGWQQAWGAGVLDASKAIKERK